jgi:hypothetical protein
MSFLTKWFKSGEKRTREVQDTDKINSLIGMTTVSERSWWSEYARNVYTGSGAIVDLGSWFGSTTCSLAEGLLQNSSKIARKQPIHAFDIFSWESWMEFSVRGTQFEGRFRPGDDFQPVFYDCTKAYQEQIICYKTDLRDYKWNGGPIEFLLVDAMKSWDLANAIYRSFFPHLIPGKSIFLHQDFAHFYTYWIHLHQYRIRAYVEPMEDTIKINSLAFKLIKALPDHLLNEGGSINEYTEQEIESAFDYSRSLVASVNLPHVDAAYVLAIRARLGQEAGSVKYREHVEKYGEHDTTGQLKRFF